MNTSLNKIKAKHRIIDIFTPEVDPVVASKDLKDDEFCSMLDAVAREIPFSKPAQNGALSRFLYAGARRFNRWFAPSPYVVPSEHKDHFAKFVAALWRAEHGDPTNCACFQVHVIKDDLFFALDGAPFTSVGPEILARFKSRVAAVPPPGSPTKLTEFLEQKAELLAILQGIEDRSLRTLLVFSVPYLLNSHGLDVVLTWSGIPVEMKVHRESQASAESFVTVQGGTASTIGASRWQTGFSKIELRLAALVDASAFTESLQALPGHDVPVAGWPKSFTTAFWILHDVAWHLRDRPGAQQNWIPAPRDLSDIESSIETSARSGLMWMRKGSPAALVHVHTPSADVLHLDLGNVQRLPWAAECRIRARMYLELGDTNEALFWLNVSVEALITQRFQEIEERTGMAGLAGELGSAKEFWAQAEEIVATQFPDLTGKVKWPTAQMHVSVFGKLKALYRRVHMRTSLDDLLRRYRQISGNRNDLFHGKSADRVPVGAVSGAMEALTWIEQNMWPLELDEGCGEVAGSKGSA